MKKATFDTFIKRSSLGDIITKTRWKYIAKDKTLHTRAAADNRCFVMDVVMNDFTDFGADDLNICIGDTSKLKAMMTPFEDGDVSVAINRSGDRVMGITFSNNDVESYCTAADPSAVEPVAKNLQDVPEYHVVLPLTEELIAQFLKASNALKDVASFSVGMNKKGLFEVVLGYTTANSNRIRITPKTLPDKNKLDAALAFPIKNVAEVLKANEDIPDGSMSINSAGILRMYFKNDSYTCTYFQFANTKKV